MHPETIEGLEYIHVALLDQHHQTVRKPHIFYQSKNLTMIYGVQGAVSTGDEGGQKSV